MALRLMESPLAVALGTGENPLACREKHFHQWLSEGVGGQKDRVAARSFCVWGKPNLTASRSASHLPSRDANLSAPQLAEGYASAYGARDRCLDSSVRRQYRPVLFVAHATGSLAVRFDEGVMLSAVEDHGRVDVVHVEPTFQKRKRA